MSDNTVKAGSVLVATPWLDGDEDFARSVVLVLGHGRGETRGITLSQEFVVETTENLGAEVIEILKRDGLDMLGGLPAAQQILHRGGPLGHDEVILLASDQATGPKSGVPMGKTGYVFNPITIEEGGIRFSSDLRQAKPQSAVLALGYARWGVGHLQNEIDNGAWVVANMDLRTLFNTPAEKRWEVAAQAAGYGAAATATPSLQRSEP